MMGRWETPHTIYAIRNSINGKVYIGKTSRELGERIKQHWHLKRRVIKNHAENPNPPCELTQFEKDFRDMGEAVFEVYCLETNVAPKMAQAREAFWINEYNSTNPKFGYNIRPEHLPFRVNYAVGLPPNLSKGER